MVRFGHPLHTSGNALADRGESGPQSVLSLMQLTAERYSRRVAFHFVADGAWQQLTYGALATKVRRLSDYFIESRFEPGERIAILSESCPDWAVAFFAAVRCGAVVVPLDTQLQENDLHAILLDVEPCLMLVSPPFAQLGMELKRQYPFLAEIILLNCHSGIATLQPLETLQATAPQAGIPRQIDETALIVYTSGTTGAPKGVMISFQNLQHQITAFEAVMKLTDRAMWLSMLPLNHLLELTCGMLGVLYAGGQITYAQSLLPQEIAHVMREKRVTCMITVPLFLKLLKASLEKDINRSGRWLRWWFRCALRLAPAVHLPVCKRGLFRTIHAQFGGQFRAFITGGAPLEHEVADFFDRLGMPVYQGYGLTETSPVISVNTPACHRRGSVGRPLPGVRVRIHHSEAASGVDTSPGACNGSGEILTAGPHIMQGYYRRADWTHAILDEKGWLHTGDLGRIDADGFLYITGRLKNVIVLSSGKKVHSEEVEAVLSQSPWIQEVVVVAQVVRDGLLHGSEAVCAIVVPAASLRHQLRDDAAIRDAITREVERLARRLAPFKRPSQVVIHYGALPKASTRKVKRAVVMAWLERQAQSAPAAC